MIGREEELRSYRERVFMFYLIVGTGIFLLLLRLFFLQVLKGEELRRYSEANRLKKERLFPARGIIFDRNGKVIVDNRAAFDVVLFRQYYPFDERTNQRLAKVLEIPIDELKRKLEKAKKQAAFHSLLLRADVSRNIIAAIEMDAEGFPGVDIEAVVMRRYPHGDLASQLLGYVGEVDKNDIKRNALLESGDYIGKMGIERQYDDILRGQQGVGYVEVDSRGRRRETGKGERLLGFIAREDPRKGSNIYLTVDLDLALAARKALMDRGFNGSVVAMDPRNGEILAMVNAPSYHPGLISGREIDQKIWNELKNNKDRPLRNRAIQDHYPPGSTFKLFVAIAGLAEGLVNLKSSVNCPGQWFFGNRTFHCWKKHHTADFLKAIRESCDVFFYKLGDALGVDRLAKYSRDFGLGSPTGLNLANEQSGLIPDTDWKRKRFNDKWHPGETLSVSIGQGYVTVTPIQLVAAYAAIGNGGFRYTPYIVKKMEKLNGEIREFSPQLQTKINIPAEVFEMVKEGLYQVVNAPEGTGVRTASNLTLISGKTGTAQVRRFQDIKDVKCEKMESKDRHHGLFVGYAPRENPEIAVGVVAEHSCHGSSAGPVIREVIETYIKKQVEEKGENLTDKIESTKRLIRELAKGGLGVKPRTESADARTEGKRTGVQVTSPSDSNETSSPQPQEIPSMDGMASKTDGMKPNESLGTETENVPSEVSEPYSRGEN